MKKFAALLFMLMLLSAGALAEPQVTRQGLELGAGYVYYPQVEGMDDPALQEAVNAALRRETGAEELLMRLPLTMSATVPLQADYVCLVQGDVLSAVTRAEGPVVSQRATQMWYAANIDLTRGEVITLDDLFSDADAARAFLEEYLEWELAPGLSAHLRSAQLTPMPESFGLSSTGLTLYYPFEQLATLSDRAGTVNLQWCEMLPYLRLGEGSVLRRLGAEDMVTLNDSSAQAIRAAAETGALPGIPAQLGASVQEAVDTYRLLIDPDLYEGGRMIQLEDGAFRGVYLLTDSLTDSWSSSVIRGIRTDRINLHGLCTGVTTREEWRAVLGESDASVTVDADKAEMNRMVPGISDYYNFQGVQLRLHANGEGVLTSVILTIN